MDRRTELLRWGAGALFVPLLTSCNCPAVGTGKYEARLVPLARYCTEGYDFYPEEQSGELEISNFDPELCESSVRFSPALILSETPADVPTSADYPSNDYRFTSIGSLINQEIVQFSGRLGAGGLGFNKQYGNFDAAFEAQLRECGNHAEGEEIFSLVIEATNADASRLCVFTYEVCLKEK